MIRKSGEFTIVNRNPAGSADSFVTKDRFTKEETFGKTRLFTEIVFEPGYLIPLHAHTGEMEIFYVLEGELVSISEDGGEEPFVKGDYMVTGGGEKHSLRNDSGKQAVIMAIIVL